MAETTTIARPYARAAFEYAQSQPEGFKRWSEMLQFAAAVVADPAMARLLESPQLADEQKLDLLLDICGQRLDTPGQNFLKILADNDRLDLLPEITELYEELRAEAEKTIEAELITAFPVDDAQQNKIAQALGNRLQRQVELRCTVDAALLGGAIIRAGDLVIDGSARGRLAQLEAALRQ